MPERWSGLAEETENTQRDQTKQRVSPDQTSVQNDGRCSARRARERVCTNVRGGKQRGWEGGIEAEAACGKGSTYLMPPVGDEWSANDGSPLAGQHLRPSAQGPWLVVQARMHVCRLAGECHVVSGADASEGRIAAGRPSLRLPAGHCAQTPHQMPA